MSGSLYSYTQVNERLATLNPEVKYDVHTLLNAIRLEKIKPIFWFDGYLSDFILPEDDAWHEIKYTSTAQFKGFVELNQQLYALKLKDLCTQKLEYIQVDFGQSFFIYDGEELLKSSIQNKKLFPYDIEKVYGLSLPFTNGDLFNNNVEPGIKVHLDDLYFFKEQIEDFASRRTDIIHDLKFEIEELKYQIEQLQDRNEYLSSQVNKVHPALDPSQEQFAPEICIALKLNEYIYEKQQEPTSVKEKTSKTDLLDAFYKAHDLNGEKTGNLRDRLTTVANFSKKDPHVLNIAKSIA